VTGNKVLGTVKIDPPYAMLINPATGLILPSNGGHPGKRVS